MTVVGETVARVVAAAEAAVAKKATDVVALDVSEHMALTDVFLICSATNERQVSAVVGAVEERMGKKPYHVEGQRQSRWVLLDYLDFIVHVQHVEERAFYDLERLWKDCPRIEVPDGNDDR